MDIKNIKIVRKDKIDWFVHTGFCDGIPTKWITQGKWDGKIRIKVENGEIIYRDSNSKELLVFENDEPGWILW